jgi:Dullard-like phosphatase family protein
MFLRNYLISPVRKPPSFIRYLFISRSYSAVSAKSNAGNSLSRLVTVMDIDECMVKAEILQKGLSVPKDTVLVRDPEDEESEVETIQLAKGRLVTLEDNETQAYVRFRPGLISFLDSISKISDVYAFTAGTSGYARPILRAIDPNGSIFKKSLFRDSCVQGSWAKDLRAFGTNVFNEKRIVLVDNNIFSFIFQPENGILIDDFHGRADDRELEKVEHLIHKLAPVEDVRVPLRNLFSMRLRLSSVN